MTDDLKIEQGKTFSLIVRWATLPFVYAAITAITKAAPAVITSSAHGVPDGWRVAVVSAGGMRQINAKNTPPRSTDYRRATVPDTSTVALNDVNSTNYSTYTSGGYLQYKTPVDLTGFTARMSIKDVVGGTELLRLDTTNARIVLDNAAKTITLTIAAADTAAITWLEGVYDLELVSGSGVVSLVMSGAVTVDTEVTTT